MSDTNWKMVTGEDGSRYFEISGVTLFADSSVPQGSFLAAALPSGGAYTLASLQAMRSAMNPYLPASTVSIKTWLPEPEPEPLPTGRFQNLDWEAA